MTNEMDRPLDPAELRKRAEAVIREKPALSREGHETLSSGKARQMIHELQVHQLELEMQNEELRRTQAELAASQARYFDLYDLAPVGYVTLSEQGLVQEANLAASKLLGLTRYALVKQPFTRFILPEGQDTFYRHRRDLFKNAAPQSYEIRMARHDGVPFWARLDATLVQDQGSGPLCRLVLSDITERKQAEEERSRLQTQLFQAQKMESVGRLAGGVAHDFNNLIHAILGYTQLALQATRPGQRLHADLLQVDMAAQRAANLTQQLLAYASKQPIAPKILDLNLALEGTLKLLSRMIGEDIELAWKPGRPLWPVKIDRSQLDQILTNLCINSRDAIANVGQIRIETANLTLDHAHRAQDSGHAPGDYVVLSICDNGCGMKQETLKHLFEPFFTTKKVGQGSGLGLATVYGIVKQNHGFIEVSSTLGQGTSFKIHLPRHQGQEPVVQTQEVQTQEAAQPTSCGKGTVLLVEDDPTILSLCRMALERLGYAVLAAGGPSEALRTAGVHPGEILLLVSDVVMPEMNGWDLAQQLQTQHPGLKRLFISGYPSDRTTQGDILKEADSFLQKPFRVKDLQAKIREVLGKD